jgi:hypothetical protein
MESKKRYQIVWDLDDAENDLREAEREYSEMNKERKALEKWGLAREIPAELWGELTFRRKKVLSLKEEVKQLENKLDLDMMRPKDSSNEIEVKMELPDELVELKCRLRLELDSNITDRVLDEWYEEYQDYYNKLMESLETSTEKNADYWRTWALQNIS